MISTKLSPLCECGHKAIPFSDICKRCTNSLSPIERMFRKTRKLANGCIEYLGTKTGDGKLRQISLKGKMLPAAKFSWIFQRGEIPKGYFVCHRCDYPACINIDHLFLGTPKENTHDASKKFRLTHGEDHWSHKLTEKDVKEMRYLFLTGFWTYAGLGRRYGINESTSARIIKGKLWKHLLQNHA